VILYVVYLYELPSRNACDFIQGFRGRLCALRELPGWIHADLLEQSCHSRFLRRFLSISFFTSFDAAQQAERSSQMQKFLAWVRDETILCVDLGTFLFPAWPDFDEESQNVGGMIRA